MKEFNKLVRDRIPAIIENNGEVANIRILNDEEYIRELNTKLMEEVREYLESGDVEELADIQEVLRAILDFKQVGISDFESIRQTKVDKRGAFKDRILLISTTEKK